MVQDHLMKFYKSPLLNFQLMKISLQVMKKMTQATQKVVLRAAKKIHVNLIPQAILLKYLIVQRLEGVTTPEQSKIRLRTLISKTQEILSKAIQLCLNLPNKKVNSFSTM